MLPEVGRMKTLGLWEYVFIRRKDSGKWKRFKAKLDTGAFGPESELKKLPHLSWDRSLVHARLGLEVEAKPVLLCQQKCGSVGVGLP